MKIKTLVTAGLALALTAGMSCAAFAGSWKVDKNGIWHYDYTGRGVQEGYLKSQWAWIDGNHDHVSECYYFDAEGNMLANTTVDGYVLNEQGQWVVDGVVQARREGVKETSGMPTEELIHSTPAESGFVENYESAMTSSGLTWENGLRFKGGVDHLANVVLNLDKDYTTMTIVFAPEAGQTVKGTGRVTVSGLTSGKTIYNSRKFDVSNEPISATFNCGGEKAIRISVIRGFDILFNSVEGHYVIHKEPGV